MRRCHRNGIRTGEAIREAAGKLFFQQGYEATSLRAIASEVGVQVGSLYNHIDAKEDLLTGIMMGVLDSVEASVRSAVDSSDGDPISRLRAGLGAHIRFHAEHARETFIGNSELRALSSESRRSILCRRDHYERLIRQLIIEAAAAVDADLIDARLQTYSALAVGMHIASWFRPGRSLSMEQVVDTYTRLLLRQMGVDDDMGQHGPSSHEEQTFI